MASVESQVQEKVDTAVLVKSAELFGRSMASFLETEMDYIGYLRDRPTRKIVVVDPEDPTVITVDDGGGPAGGGSLGGFPGIPPRLRGKGKGRGRGRGTRTKGRGGTAQRGAQVRRALGGGPRISQGRGGQGRGLRLPGTGPKVTTGTGGNIGIGQRLSNLIPKQMPKSVTGARVRGGAAAGAMILADIFMPQLQDFVGSIYSKFGAGYQAMSDDDLIKAFNMRGMEIMAAKQQAEQSNMPGRYMMFESMYGEEFRTGTLGVISREMEKRGMQPPMTQQEFGFSEGAVINTPTRGYVGEAGPEVIFPVGKIGEAINAVYREGGSAMIGATLAFLHASPMSPTNSVLLSEAGRLKQQFGVSGDFAQIKGIGNYEVKPVPSLEESINNQSSSGQNTTQSQSIIQRFQSFLGGAVNSVLGIGPANAAPVPFNGAFIRGDLANTQVQNEITAKGLYLGAGEKKDGHVGHRHLGITRGFGTKDGLGSGASAGGHGGIDIGTSQQTGYYVSFSMGGKVSFAGPAGGYGNLVIIESGGHDYYFAHLASISSGIREGQPYTGQTIGEIGRTDSTGNTTGEHLHFEKRTAGGGVSARMNPAAELGALSIGRTTKPTAPANKPVKPADPSKAKTTVTTTPVTQSTKNGQATSTQVPVPVPIPQQVKQFVAVPVEAAKSAVGFVVDIFGKGGGKK